jgi:hypothetical protein
VWGDGNCQSKIQNPKSKIQNLKSNRPNNGLKDGGWEHLAPKINKLNDG